VSHFEGGQEKYKMKLIYSLIAVSVPLVSCSAPSVGRPTGNYSPDYASRDTPSSFDFNIKNGDGDTLIIRYFYGKVFVSEKIVSVTKSFDLEPAAEDWSAFRQAMNSVGVWEWNSGVDPGEPDFWALSLHVDGHDVDINGTHFNRDGWNAFASAIEKLIKHRSPLIEASKSSGENGTI
jgi:hypothetical protein